MKVCPFCCSECLILMQNGPLEGPHWFHVECGDCLARGPEAANGNAAAEHWNRAERQKWTKEEIDRIKKEAEEIATFLGFND